MPEKTTEKVELLFEQWKVASELHRHEDNLTWQKVNYFIAVLGALLTAYFVLGNGLPLCDQIRARFYWAVFGLAVSILWLVVHVRGSLYHTLRINQALEIEKILGSGGQPDILNLYSKGQITETERDKTANWVLRCVTTLSTKIRTNDAVSCFIGLVFLVWLYLFLKSSYWILQASACP